MHELKTVYGKVDGHTDMLMYAYCVCGFLIDEYQLDSGGNWVEPELYVDGFFNHLADLEINQNYIYPEDRPHVYASTRIQS